METSVVYRHLEGLRTLGFVEAHETIEGPGRPKKFYRVSDEGLETFPRDYAFLSDALVRQIIEQQGEKALVDLLRPIGEGLGAPLRDAKDPEATLDDLIGLYNRLGFEASLEPGSGELVLTQRNCPFLKIAKVRPEAVCKRLDEQIMRSALPGATVSLERTMAKGDDRCVHRIEMPRTRRFRRRAPRAGR